MEARMERPGALVSLSTPLSSHRRLLHRRIPHNFLRLRGVQGENKSCGRGSEVRAVSPPCSSPACHPVHACERELRREAMAAVRLMVV